MSPGAPKAAVTERDEDADGNHARIPCLFLLARHIYESTQPSMSAFMNEVYEILANSVQPRGEGLVLDSAIELDIVDSLLPDNCVAGFDVEVNEEKSGNGRKVGKMGHGGRGGNGELRVLTARGGHCE